VTYGDDGDGLVDNNNALTTMASALKSYESDFASFFIPDKFFGESVT
jgi:hypothetical protein